MTPLKNENKPWDKQRVRGTVCVLAAVLICMALHILCGSPRVISMTYCIPLAVSLIYLDLRVLRLSYFASSLGYIICAAAQAMEPHPAIDAADVISAAAALGVLFVIFFLSRLALKRGQELAEEVNRSHLRAKRDELTGLGNHTSFYERLDMRIKRHNETGEEIYLLILDIDNFKSINDRYGSSVGDEVIMTLVNSIGRAAEEREELETFRYGGEEFAVLMRSGGEEALDFAERVRRSFCRDTQDLSWNISVSVSIGICRYDPIRFGARREYFAAVDEALYKAKKSGKDKTVLWTEN
ncbi:MAG: GGDEF domain-containing protein [Oscillospiraceae bacterium]|jgi:diguanylate cyclase (GGDEF)-like protein|nr:GGDEF domain-containing protein [Oscillospiraceae bacterium]